MSIIRHDPKASMHHVAFTTRRHRHIRNGGPFVLALIATLLVACGGGTQRPTFRSLDQFNAYIDTMPKAGVIDLTDATFRSLVLHAAKLDEDMFETCIMEPLRQAFLEDETFLLMLPDSTATVASCAEPASRRFYWRMTEAQRIAWNNTDVQLRERFVNTVATYRAALQNDPKVSLRYIGLGRLPETGYRDLQAARLSLGDGVVYSVNLR